MAMTSTSVLVNLKNWTWNIGKYKMADEEYEAIKPILERVRPLPLKRSVSGVICPRCGIPIDADSNFCKWCGQGIDQTRNRGAR